MGKSPSTDTVEFVVEASQRLSKIAPDGDTTSYTVLPPIQFDSIVYAYGSVENHTRRPKFSLYDNTDIKNIAIAQLLMLDSFDLTPHVPRVNDRYVTYSLYNDDKVIATKRSVINIFCVDPCDLVLHESR